MARKKQPAADLGPAPVGNPMSEDHEGESALAQPSAGGARRALRADVPVCNCCHRNDRVQDLNAAWNASTSGTPRTPDWFCRRCVGYLEHLNGTTWAGGPKAGQLVYPPAEAPP